jgi:hypothetical protein
VIPALWLARRELATRWPRVALAVAVVAAIAGAATAMELVARAREEAVAVRIDAIGPAVTLVARGVTAAALARYDLGPGVLPPDVPARVEAALGAELRAVEGRLVVLRDVAGTRTPVVGVPPGGSVPLPARADGVVVGSEVGRHVGAAPLSLDGRAFRVEGTLPSTATVEDTAVFLPLEVAQGLAGVAGVNELRVFLRAGASPRDAAERLVAHAIPAAVLRADRGEVADGEAHVALARHRRAAYGVMAAVAALCLLIAAHLDASERRVEVATLVAIGAGRATVLAALVARSAIVSAAGALIGVVGGVALAAAQDPAVAASVWRAWPVAAGTLLAAVVVGVAAAGPTALACALRDPVPELQEG